MQDRGYFVVQKLAIYYYLLFISENKQVKKKETTTHDRDLQPVALRPHVAL